MIQLVVITDDHSWVAGHTHNHIHMITNNNDTDPNTKADSVQPVIALDADYGHVVSFYERLKVVQEEKAKDNKKKKNSRKKG
mmetsp:Transcript_54378/g.60793  ORF Transcript_54378/g.60793 Transcript_54378/m.60793 type:complete len:82 (-) Transcript_54378:231-476(-)